jgi:hypothetical protein
MKQRASTREGRREQALENEAESKLEKEEDSKQILQDVLTVLFG